MKAAIPSLLLLLALNVPALAVTCSSCGIIRGAPGPLMGAGLLPVLLVGGGIYWLVRRKKTQSS
jgi:LPXTG-motif cell wall-anchored protein